MTTDSVCKEIQKAIRRSLERGANHGQLAVALAAAFGQLVFTKGHSKEYALQLVAEQWDYDVSRGTQQKGAVQ